MFGVLNRFIARLDSDPEPLPHNVGPSDSSYGFQVLRNTNAELPIEPWFDFVIGINGHVVVRARLSLSMETQGSDSPQDDPDPQLFSREVINCAGSSLSLEIWTAKVGKRQANKSWSLCLKPAVVGSEISHPHCRCTSCAAGSWPHPPTGTSECYTKYLAHPLHTFSTISSASRGLASTVGLHTWDSFGDSSRRSCFRRACRRSSQ